MSRSDALSIKSRLDSLWDEYLNVNIRKALMEHTVPMMIIESEEISREENLLEQYRFYNDNISGCTIRSTKYLPQIEDARTTAGEIRAFLS